MTPTLAYSKSSAGGINSALDKIFHGFGDELRFARASNVNFFVPVSSVEKLKQIEPLLFDLAEIHPSRFFLLYQDQSKADFDIEIGALCQVIAKGQHACAEIVRIGYKAELETALPSIVQASLLTGAPSELFIFDPKLSQTLLFKLLGMSDRVIFDSEQLSEQIWGAGSLLTEKLLTARAQLVDLQWIKLGVWRDQIKNFFNKPIFTHLLEDLRAIHFRVGAVNPAGCPAHNLLRAWMIERLKLRFKSGSVKNLEMLNPAGRIVNIGFTALEGKNNLPGLHEVSMNFGPAPNQSNDLERIVSWYREDRMLVTLLSSGTGYKVSRPIEETNAFEALKRYFLIGESILNYEPALRTAFGLPH